MGARPVGIVKKGQLLFILSFAVLILLGTLLLKLPWAYNGDRLAWIDAFYVATNSVCVTGMSFTPIADFNLYGQLIILFLIQLGGLGIMTLSASILLMVGKGLSFNETLVISNLNDNFSWRGTEGLTRTVVHFALISEGIGFLLLLPGFWVDYSAGEAIWYALFHAVSGFCNAGTTPFQNSLIDQSRWIHTVMILLFTVGGFGVYVIYDVLQVIRRRQRHLSVHSRLVLWTSLILLLGGTVLLYVLGVLAEQPISLFDALFQSAASRTAGFSTVEITAMPGVSLTVMIMLMLIGGSPGSTSGGMKTSTAGLAFVAILSTYKGNPEVRLFRRSIPSTNVLRAFTIIVTFLLLTCAGAMMVQILTPVEFDMSDCFFEAASAISTTGFSTGVTEVLTPIGKVCLALNVFAGRIGPFTIMLFLLGREKRRHLQYPEERIIIG